MSLMFGECLAEWMKEYGLTPSSLAEKTGYRSKTTVNRFLQGNSGYESCRRYLSALENSFQLTEEWQRRFLSALLAEKYGRERYRIYRALYGRIIANREAGRPAPPQAAEGMDLNGEMLILGCPRQEIYGLVSEALERFPGARIRHYMTEKELLACTFMFEGLTSFLTDSRYEVFLVKDEAEESGIWNVVCSRSREGGTCLLGEVRGQFSAFVNDREQGILERMEAHVSFFRGRALYRFDHLEKGADYVRFLKECCRFEKDRSALIVKPSPGIQMIPVGITGKGLHLLFDQTELFNVKEMDEAMTALRCRVDNFYGRKEKTCLVFSWEGISRFAENGMLADQLYMLDPYSPGERKQILSELLRFAQEPNTSLHFLEGDGVLPFSYECYAGAGTLIYPSNTNYHTESAPYRELYIPGKSVVELLGDFTVSLMIPEYCLGREESAARLEELLARMPGD